MKIIKISQENTDVPEKTFFNLEERRKLEKMKDEVYKKAIVDYYKKYGNQSDEIDEKIRKMMEEFKDEDFFISIIYKKLYDKARKATIEYYGEHPFTFNDTCPEEFKQDPELLNALKPDLVEFFSNYPKYYDDCPEYLQTEVLDIINRNKKANKETK